jgi:hypothetical protein
MFIEDGRDRAVDGVHKPVPVSFSLLTRGDRDEPSVLMAKAVIHKRQDGKEAGEERNKPPADKVGGGGLRIRRASVMGARRRGAR